MSLNSLSLKSSNRKAFSIANRRAKPGLTFCRTVSLVLETCQFTYVEHIYHLLFVTKKQDTSVLAGHALDFSDDCVDYRGFEWIGVSVSVSTFSTAAI